MNILDKVKSILGMDAYLGVQPDKPDKCVTLTEYPGRTEPFFGGTADIYAVQARTRAKTPDEAFSLAEDISAALDRYTGQGVAIRRTSPILDIGQDDKGRREYTVNFSITSTGG